MPNSKSSSEDSYIPRFPQEITEKILSHCDSDTLFNARLADNICYDIVGKRIEWNTRCKNELKPRLLEELLLEMHPKYWFSDKNYGINWMSVYECWMLWRKFKPGKVEKLYDSKFLIHNLQVSGSVAFVAHSKGVEAVNLMNKKSQTIYYGMNLQGFRSMDLFCSKKAPIHNKTLEGCLHDNLDLFIHSRFHHVVNLHKKYHPDREYQPELEQTITRYHKNATLHVTDEIRTSEFSLFVDGKLTQHTNEPNILESIGISLWNNTISYFVCDSVEVRNYNLDIIISGVECNNGSPKAADCPCNCLKNRAFKLKYWKYGVFFATTMCNKLYVNIKNQDAYYDTPQKTITSLEIHQNILFLGTDVGYISMHRIKNLDDLLQLDIESHEYQIDVVDGSIKAMKCYQIDCKPGIVVATLDSLYRISIDIEDDA